MASLNTLEHFPHCRDFRCLNFVLCRFSWDMRSKAIKHMLHWNNLQSLILLCGSKGSVFSRESRSPPFDSAGVGTVCWATADSWGLPFSLLFSSLLFLTFGRGNWVGKESRSLPSSEASHSVLTVAEHCGRDTDSPAFLLLSSFPGLLLVVPQVAEGQMPSLLPSCNRTTGYLFHCIFQPSKPFELTA